MKNVKSYLKKVKVRKLWRLSLSPQERLTLTPLLRQLKPRQLLSGMRNLKLRPRPNQYKRRQRQSQGRNSSQLPNPLRKKNPQFRLRLSQRRAVLWLRVRILKHLRNR